MTNPQLLRIYADLDRIPRAFVLTDRDLGSDLIKAATEGVKATIARQEAPDGTPWAKLSPAYASWKARKFPGQPIGRLHDLMAADEQVEGVPAVGPEEASVTYGTTEEAREEAELFQEGSDDGTQPPRDFYDFTRESEAACAAILDRRFDDATR